MIPTLVQGLAMDCLPTLKIMSQDALPTEVNRFLKHITRFGEANFKCLFKPIRLPIIWVKP